MSKPKIFNGDIPDDLEIIGDMAIDTEAMGLNYHRDRLCTVQFCDSKQNNYIIQYDGKNYNSPNLAKYLLDSNRVKIFHYARFDVAIIDFYLKIETQNIFCTKIASKLSRTYTDNHGLKDLTRELLGVNISKTQQSSYWGAAELSTDQIDYAINDVIHLHKLRDVLTEMLKREDRLALAQKLFDFLPVRAKLDILGWNNNDIFAHGS